MKSNEPLVIHPSPFRCVGIIILPMVLLVLAPLDALLIVGVVFFLESLLVVFSLISLVNTSYVITGEVIEAREGILVVEVRSIPISQVVDVTCEQGLFQRLMGIGNLFIKTAGMTDGKDFEMAFLGIKNPFAVAEFILNARKGSAV